MPWIALYVFVGVGGLAVLAWCAARVGAAVRDLGREVRRAEEAIEPKLAALRDATNRGDHA